MFTTLGVFAIAHAAVLMYTSVNMPYKSVYSWPMVMLDLGYVTASLACLALAYLCFGGGW